MCKLKTKPDNLCKASKKYLPYIITVLCVVSFVSLTAYNWSWFLVNQSKQVTGQVTGQVAGQAGRGIDKVTSLESRTLALDARIDQMQQSMVQIQTANTMLQKQHAEQASAIAALQTTAHATSISDDDRQKVDQLKSLAQELQNKLVPLQKLALVSAVNSLKASVDTGQAFSSSLALVKNIGTNDPAISSSNLQIIEQYAANGIATQQMLLEEFTNQSNKIHGMGDSANMHAPSSQKLWGWLKQQITIRHTSGKLAGANPEDILARIEYYLKQSAFDKANAELASLPAAIRQSLQGFAIKLQARIAANKAMQLMLQQLSDTTHNALPPVIPIPENPQ